MGSVEMKEDDIREETEVHADAEDENGLKVRGVKNSDCKGGGENIDEHAVEDNSDNQNDDENKMRDKQESCNDGNDVDPEEGQSLLDEYGRPLSAYEIMRLERIKRNQAYLAKLGLESDEKIGKKGTLLSQHEEELRKKRNSKRKAEVLVERRSSVGRRSKAKKIDYTDRPAKWKDDESSKEKTIVAKNVKVGKKQKRADSLPLFIYREFNNMRVIRRQNLKTAEKLLRLAEIEYRIANRELDLVQRKERRSRERETRDVLLPIVRDIERRRVDIIKALRRVDEGRKKELNQIDLRKEMTEKLDEAKNKFPEAIKQALTSLGKMMLDRIPESEKLVKDVTLTKKKKNKSQENGGKAGSEGKEEKATLPLNIDLDELRIIEQSEKVRVQKMRNVGGPVTEKLAKAVQRKWLDGDGPVGACFNEYVPQVGDTVLYYPCAHYDFSRSHPDIRCKKGRLTLRKTLWERAIEEKKLEETAKDNQDVEIKEKKRVEKPWWTMEWISSIQHGAGRYPILCKVEKAVAEFPYDQESQTEIRRLQNDAMKPKHSGDSKRKHSVDGGRQKPSKKKPPMCLVVTLRPLAPITPRKETHGEELLSTPPLFSVLMFPSEKMPYLIPFALAFRSSLIFSTSEENVKVADSDGVIRKAKVLALEQGHSDLCEKVIHSFQVILNETASIDIRSVQKLDSFVSEAYSKHGNCQLIPEGDLRAVIQTILYHYHTRNNMMNLRKEVGPFKSSKRSSLGVKDMALSFLTNLTHLIRCSLPKWESVAIEIDGIKEIKRVCPWQLSFPDDVSLGDDINAALAPSVLFSPNRVVVGGYVHLIDEALRSKLESAIKYMVDNDQMMLDFIAPVNISLAPEYMRFVPIPTCFRKILKRLKRQHLKYPKTFCKSGEDILEDNGYGDNQCCFYRSIEALRSDITDVFQNCLLYNAPDSGIVLAAFHATKLLKLVVQRVAENHQRDKYARRKAEAEQLANADLAAKGELMLVYSKKTSISPGQVEKFGHTYKGPLQRSWLENIEKSKTWLPQCGDMVIYNRVHHGRFINGHLGTLSISQRALPSILPPSIKTAKSIAAHSTESDHSDLSNRFQYFIGTVVWIRAVFPSFEAVECCSDASPLYAIGIRFHYRWLSKSIQVVYWKPCCSYDGTERRDDDICKSCGLHINQSFLSPAWVGPLDKVLPPFPLSLISSSSTLPIGISTEYAKRVYACMKHLKKRVVRNTPADKFQPHGYFLDDCINNFSDIPKKFQHIFEEDEDLVGDDAQDSSQEMTCLLSRKCFMEPWASADIGTKTLNISTRATKSSSERSSNLLVPFHETCIANPNLSLRVIQQRVRNGFYRGRDAIINDIREACASSITYIIKDRVRTKRLNSNSEVSLLKAAIQSCGVDINDFLIESRSQVVGNKDKRLVVPTTSESTDSEVKSQSNAKAAISIKNLSHQERATLVEILNIFKLHAVALVIVLETASAEIALGVEPPRFDERCGTLSFEQELARKNLHCMLTSIGPDKMKFRKPIPAGSEPPNVNVLINIKNCDGTLEIDTGIDFDFSKPIILERKIYERSPRLKQILGGPPSHVISSTKVFIKCEGLQRTTGDQIILNPENYSRLLCSSNIFDSFRKDGRLPQIKITITSEDSDFTEKGSQINCNPGSNLGKTMDTDEIKLLNDEGVVSIERQSDDSDSFTNKQLSFFPSDYLGNQSLIRALFCRSKRRQTCVKCVLGKKGLFACRVRHAHSNHDPNWVEYYRSQRGIDAILTILDPNHKPPPELSISRDVTDEQDDTVSECGSESKSQAHTEASTNEEDIVASLEVASATHKEAESAMSLARELQDMAEKEMQSPLVLSAEFMRTNFDVDPEDGHFEICPKCGLGGDVICCESCPMVSHPKCEKMTEIPDEEWHCYYCVSRMKRNDTKSKTSKSSMLKRASKLCSQIEDMPQSGTAEVGFDRAVENLTNTLERLKQSRQKPLTITVGSKLVKEFDGVDYVGEVIELASDDCEYYKVRYEDSDEEELSLEELQACITAYSKMQKPNESKSVVAPTEVKRRRGRPRKDAMEVTVIRKRGRPPKNKSYEERTNYSSRIVNHNTTGIKSDLQPKRRGRPPKRLNVDTSDNERVLKGSLKNDVHSTDINAVYSRRSRRRGVLDNSQKSGGRSNALQSNDSFDVTTRLPKRKRGRPRKYPINLSEDSGASSLGKGYPSKRSKQLSSEPTILLDNMPSPGHIDKSMSYYCTLENDTSAKIAAAIGCESWLDVAYIPENLERFPALLDKKIKFKRGTLVRIAECKISKKKAAALIE